MNKLLILLLAICLVSVHAFVKRDAPAPNAGGLDEFTNKFKELAENFKNQFEKVTDPDEIKRQFNTFVDNVNGVINKGDKPAA